MGQGAPVVMHEQLRRHIERAQALLSGDAGPLQISDSVSEKYSVLRPLFAQSLLLGVAKAHDVKPIIH